MRGREKREKEEESRYDFMENSNMTLTANSMPSRAHLI